jgi:hypothetical protein
VGEVITEPSVLAFLPTMMLVHDMRLRPASVDSSTCAIAGMRVNANAIAAIMFSFIGIKAFKMILLIICLQN